MQLDQWLDEVAAMNLIDLYAEECGFDAPPPSALQLPSGAVVPIRLS